MGSVGRVSCGQHNVFESTRESLCFVCFCLTPTVSSQPLKICLIHTLKNDKLYLEENKWEILSCCVPHEHGNRSCHIRGKNLFAQANWQDRHSGSSIFLERIPVDAWWLPRHLVSSFISYPFQRRLYIVFFVFPSSNWLWKFSPIPTICSGIHSIEPSVCCAMTL